MLTSTRALVQSAGTLVRDLTDTCGNLYDYAVDGGDRMNQYGVIATCGGEDYHFEAVVSPMRDVVREHGGGYCQGWPL